VRDLHLETALKLSWNFKVLVWLLAFFSVTHSSSSGNELTADINVTRLSDDDWRVEYHFSRPITGLLLGPSVSNYRSTSWKVLASGLSLEEKDGEDQIVSSGKTFSRVEIAVKIYTEFPPKNYVPFAKFSNGGASIYLQFFVGDAVTSDGVQHFAPRFHLSGRDGERVILPRQASGENAAFAYFGPQEPVDTGQTLLIVDPQMPPWLRKIFGEIVPAVTQVYESRLQHKLAEKPVVMIAAGELEEFDGYSVKGGAIHGQVMMTLRGSDLLKETSGQRKMFEKHIGHELAHLWQQGTVDQGFNDEEPWIHEGSAEAMAVAALADAGLWKPEDVEKFTLEMREQCKESLGGSNLAEAVGQGNWSAVYSCGYEKFNSRDPDVFDVWVALSDEARNQDIIYTQAMLDKVLSEFSSGRKKVE